MARPGEGGTAAPSPLAARPLVKGRSVYLETFTAPKDPASAHDNEDRLVAYGGRTFAVIDGVTDKRGVRHAGRTGGVHAGHALEGALRAMTDDDTLARADAAEVVDRLNQAIREAYVRFGELEAAADDPGRRFGAALAVAHLDGPQLRLLLVGDCGARVGERVWHRAHPADDLLAALRSEAFEVLGEALPHRPVEERLDLARAYTVAGVADALPERPLADADHRALAARVRARLRAEFPGLDERLRDALADGGLRAAARLRAHGGTLGHGVLDGFPVDPGDVDDVRLPWAEVEALELFSDGYFGLATPGGTVAAWEAHADLVEREDPYRIGRFRSTKGSRAGQRADDRTVLILRKEPPTP